MRLRTAFLALILIIAAIGATNYITAFGTKELEAELIQLDLNDVHSIVLNKADREITLTKERVGWIVSNGQTSTKTTAQPIELLVNNLRSVQIEEILTKNPEEWKSFHLSENEGLLVRIFGQQRLAEAFYLGKADSTDFYQFIRLAGDKEIYRLRYPGIPVFSTQLRDYRSHNFLHLPEFAVDSIHLYHSDSLVSTVVRKPENILFNDKTLIDSSTFSSYLQEIKSLDSKLFADNFDELEGKGLPQQTLSFHFNQYPDSIFIQYFQDTLKQNKFTLKSSQNDAFFRSDSSGLFKKVFLGFQKLGL